MTRFLHQLTPWEPLRLYDSPMAAYRVLVRKSDGGFSVSCPELPGCWSQGATEAEALANIQIAIEEYLDAAEEMGQL